MSTQITLMLPDNIYQQIERVAQSTNRPVSEVLTETIVSAFPPLHVSQDRPAMQREVAAFEAMHAQLWEQFSNQYVAIHQGTVVDHDVNEIALVERIDRNFPTAIVLIRQVLPQPPSPLVFRSPRLVKS